MSYPGKTACVERCPDGEFPRDDKTGCHIYVKWGIMESMAILMLVIKVDIKTYKDKPTANSVTQQI